MTFSYDKYYRQDCIVPLILILFCLIFMVKVIITMITKGTFDGLASFIKTNAFRMLALTIFVFLITINSIHLSRGGIYLLFEDEQQSIQINGVIEQTYRIDSLTGSKYDVEQNHGRGEVIVVNGKKYYLMTFGDLVVGDNVIIDVLPKSGFVLKCKKVNSLNRNTGKASVCPLAFVRNTPTPRLFALEWVCFCLA